jgi:hypothetical protein
MNHFEESALSKKLVSLSLKVSGTVASLSSVGDLSSSKTSSDYSFSALAMSFMKALTTAGDIAAPLPSQSPLS